MSYLFWFSNNGLNSFVKFQIPIQELEYMDSSCIHLLVQGIFKLYVYECQGKGYRGFRDT